MPSPSSVRPVSHASVALGLALVIPSLGGGAAMAQDEPSLCEAIDLAALNARGGPAFAQPESAGPTFCFYEASPEQAGPHSMYVSLEEPVMGFTFDDILATALEGQPGSVEVTVAGRRGFIDAESSDAVSVVVDLGERVLTAYVDITDSAEAGELDEGEYVLGVAEAAVHSLIAAGLVGDPAAQPVVAEPELPAVEGIEWRVSRSLHGAELEADLEGVLLELWELLLAQSGAGYESASMVEAVALDPAGGGRLGTYQTLSVAGGDAAALAPALVEWLAGLQGEGFGSSTTNVAGREVITIVVDGEPTGYLYAEGGTLHAIGLTGDAAERVLEALP